MPPFWHPIRLSLFSEYGIIWRTLRNTWLYQQENIKSSGRFFCFRKTFLVGRHCDSILTCNWSFLCTAGEGKVMRVPKFTSHDVICEPASLRDQRCGCTAKIVDFKNWLKNHRTTNNNLQLLLLLVVEFVMLVWFFPCHTIIFQKYMYMLCLGTIMTVW